MRRKRGGGGGLIRSSPHILYMKAGLTYKDVRTLFLNPMELASSTATYIVLQSTGVYSVYWS